MEDIKKLGGPLDHLSENGLINLVRTLQSKLRALQAELDSAREEKARLKELAGFMKDVARLVEEGKPIPLNWLRGKIVEALEGGKA